MVMNTMINHLWFVYKIWVAIAITINSSGCVGDRIDVCVCESKHRRLDVEEVFELSLVVTNWKKIIRRRLETRINPKKIY